MEKRINLIYDDIENVRVYAVESAASLPIRREYKQNGSMLGTIDRHFRDGWFETIGSYNLYDASFCDLEDVKKYPERKFYYIIETGVSMKFLLEEIKILPLTIEVRSYLKSFENLKIMFINSHECDTEDVLNILDAQIEKEGLNPSQFYIINNNYKLSENKEKSGSKINVHTLKLLPTGNLAHMSKFKHEIQNDKLFNFMCFNRNPGVHRVMLLSMLKERDLLHDFDWSLLKGFALMRFFDGKIQGMVDLYLEGIFGKEDLQKHIDEIKYFAKLGTKKSMMEDYLEIPQDINAPNNLPGNKIFLENPYQKSYINVTTETLFYDDVIHITEKTFIPFYFYQLPIIVGNYKMVEKIKEVFGFDFFDDFIDHSYDQESNPKKRLEMIVNEIERLNKDPEKIKDFYIRNNDRLIANNQICLEIAQGKTDDRDFWYSLLD